MRKNPNYCAVFVTDAISRLPEEAKEIVREAQGIADRRKRQWLRGVAAELQAARKEGRRPIITPCPPGAFCLDGGMGARTPGRAKS